MRWHWKFFRTMQTNATIFPSFAIIHFHERLVQCGPFDRVPTTFNQCKLLAKGTPAYETFQYPSSRALKRKTEPLHERELFLSGVGCVWTVPPSHEL